MKCVFALMMAALLMLSAGRSVLGHGFELDLVNNKIEAHPEDEDNFSNHVFFAPLNQLNSHDFLTDHGGVEVESGINPGSDPDSDTLQIQFLSPLWYSNGGVVQRASSGVTLEAISFDSSDSQIGSPVDITGASAQPGSFPVSGEDAHSIGWELFNPTTDPVIPQGAYGFAYRVKGYKNGDLSTPFESSVPLVVVFSTPTFAGDSLNNAQLAIFSAIMRGDFNLDGQRSAADIAQMLGALVNLSAYQTSLDLSDADVSAIADVDQNGVVTNADLQALLDLLKSGGGGTSSVPEPSAGVLACIGMIWLAGKVWRKDRRSG